MQKIRELAQSSHPYSCFILAAIEYNNAMFQIFSGPLFGNVEGYVYLDLIIWGVSPLLFLPIRKHLIKIIKPPPPVVKPTIDNLPLEKTDQSMGQQVIENEQNDDAADTLLKTKVGVKTKAVKNSVSKTETQATWIDTRLCTKTDITRGISWRKVGYLLRWKQSEAQIVEQIRRHNMHLEESHQVRLEILCVGTVAVLVSFLFMNYSQTFNWNYFTRIINLDIGYLIFDIACRSMQVVVEVEEDEEEVHSHPAASTELMCARSCKVYCRHKNMWMGASYGVIFFLFLFGFDVKEHYSGQDVLAISSLLSCLVTFSIPLLYFLHFKGKYFKKWEKVLHNATQRLKGRATLETKDYFQNSFEELSLQDQLPSEESYPDEVQQELAKISKIICKRNSPCSPASGKMGPDLTNRPGWITIRREHPELDNILWVFVGVNLSYMVNMSYLTLWIMESLKEFGKEAYVQYNESILLGGAFFLLSALLYALVSKGLRRTLGFMLDFGSPGAPVVSPHNWDSNYSQTPNNCMLMILKGSFLFFAILLLGSFSTFIIEQYKVYMYLVLTIGFGLHFSLLNYLTFLIEARLAEYGLEECLDVDELSLKLETIAYLAVPVLITVASVTESTYGIYGTISSTLMLFVAVRL